MIFLVEIRQLFPTQVFILAADFISLNFQINKLQYRFMITNHYTTTSITTSTTTSSSLCILSIYNLSASSPFITVNNAAAAAPFTTVDIYDSHKRPQTHPHARSLCCVVTCCAANSFLSLTNNSLSNKQATVVILSPTTFVLYMMWPPHLFVVRN